MSSHSEVMPIAPEAFRQVLGLYPTGVAAITGIDPDGEPVAMVVGTFSSVSLNPPLVGFMPTRTSGSYARLRSARVLCANVLSKDQEMLCRRLARPGGPEKFEGVDWTPSPAGAPIISGGSAWVEFTIAQRVEAGDHDIVIGDVSELGVGDGGLPLLFLGGGYGRYTAHSRIMPTTADSVQQIRWAEAVRAELERLSDELGLETVFVSLIDDAIVQVASYGSTDTAFRPHPLGVKLPLGAPMGAPIIASSTEPARRAWLQRSQPGLDERSVQEHFEALDRVRERGWSLNLMTQSSLEMDQTLRPLENGELAWGRIPLGDDLGRPGAYGAELPEDPEALLHVRNVSSPVRDAEGNPIFYLTLFGFGDATRSAEVRRAIDALQGAIGTVEGIIAAL